MLDFIIVSLPRSGSTWIANWLTGSDAYCTHDPLWRTHYADMDGAIRGAAGDRAAGISCTGLWRWHHWVNEHPARKLVIERPVSEVQASLSRAGLPRLPDGAQSLLDRINGSRVQYRDLFDPIHGSAIWNYLVGTPFDAERHAMLREMRVEPKFDRVSVDWKLAARLAGELSNSCS